MRSRTKLALTLAAPLVGLLASEVAVRLARVDPVPAPEVRGVLFRPSLVPGLTYENRAGAVRRTTYRGAPGAPGRVVVQRVNGQGMRGPEVSRAKPANTFRVACLGDSHTFGTGVPEGRTWPARLRELAARGGRRVEVLNLGVSAYDTAREVVLLRERALEWEPDLVLLQYHVNDVHPRNALGWKPGPDDAWMRLADPGRGGWVGALRARSRLAALLLDRLYRWRAARDESGLSLAGYAPDAEGWTRVRESLLEARDLLAARGTPFAVALFPYLLRRGEHLSSHAAFERVRAFCRAEGIPCFDGEPVFLGRDVEALRVHPHDFHANGEAYALFAEALARWCARELDVPWLGVPEPGAGT